MSNNRFEQDQLLTFGNPWHGRIEGGTLVVSEAVSKTRSGLPIDPYTHLVEFPGLPAAPPPTEADTAAGMALKNFAILVDSRRCYGLTSAIQIGPDSHVYLTADRTHYHVEVVAASNYTALAVGASRTMAVSLKTRRETGSGLGIPATMLSQTLTVTGIGIGEGYYMAVSTFSPNGLRVAITVHKFASAEHAAARDVRRSLGVCGVWEAVISGGDADSHPSGVLAQIKTAAECNVEPGDAGRTPVVVGVSVAGREGSTTSSAVDETGAPLPSGQTMFAIIGFVDVEFEYFDWNGAYTFSYIRGTAYNNDSALCLFIFEKAVVETSSYSYSGPGAGTIDRYARNIQDVTDDYSVVRWVDYPSDIPYSFSGNRVRTTSFRLKIDGASAVESVLVERFDNISGARISFQDGHRDLAYDEAEDAGVSTTITLDGATPPVSGALPAARMTSNNTACLQLEAASLGFGAPSGTVGSPGAIVLDSAGLPWAAWNPKTYALATTPGHSWL